VWKFLARPDLTAVSQFLEVVEFIAAHASGDEGELASARTLKEIRLGHSQIAGGMCSATQESEDEFGYVDLFDYVGF
jgi:hypothetical protein